MLKLVAGWARGPTRNSREEDAAKSICGCAAGANPKMPGRSTQAGAQLFFLHSYVFFVNRQCWGSVTFWCGSGSAYPYLWLTDPDPTPFFSDFKDAKKEKKYIFFLITYPEAHYLHSLVYCFIDNKWLQALFQSAQHLYEKEKDPGGPKTCGSCRSGSPTLVNVLVLRHQRLSPSLAPRSTKFNNVCWGASWKII